MSGIGTIIHFRDEESFVASVKKAKEIGLSCFQLAIWNYKFFEDKYAEIIKKTADEEDMRISALWAGWTGPCEWNFSFGPSTIGLVPPAYRHERLRQLFMASDFAEKLGIRDIVTHVGFIPENPDSEEFTGTVGALRNLCKAMEKKGQNFLFETGQETPVTMLRTIQAIGTQNLGINFDTANLILYGKANTLDALDVFGQYVRNTHIKDGLYPTDGMHLGKETPLGEGKANIPAVLAKLKELGYEGDFIIEREISGDKQIADVIMAKEMLEGIMPELKI
ncbi:MAG: sugar phosphate isomerase/epimerase [Ruminococcaceae bacterium]|nr:sugar phosphate isomerase/epimerase [Oscillospiraceae bacterium]